MHIRNLNHLMLRHTKAAAGTKLTLRMKHKNSTRAEKQTHMLTFACVDACALRRGYIYHCYLLELCGCNVNTMTTL